ncbi:glycosyltransferase family 2 protein [Patescibacteria group bacterium]|nr:glycosyltransferase family 2 protein [Patescibacteria group bacterium]MBU1472746.1 glycosyltransferase family 2 protein [Patescibacteria group bacterium]MBU2460013.1 glycosyltransferase family 2 protein [Patescibacteria group bacterium]MBU2544329.1 glycosyltransferase family 2 protein [Patescibacteria group bacterium]
MTVSVVISAWNEEEKIERCLSSLAWADEIIVVDNASSDKTADIARKFTERVYKKSNLPMLNTNKNFGFTKATGDWVLNLDADEEVPPALAKEIRECIKSNPQENGFWIKRKNISFGKWIRHGLWWPDKQIRLFRRGFGQFPCIHIHEYIKVDGVVGELVEPYIHYNYETVHQYLTKIDRYSTSEARLLSDAKHQLSWHDAIRFPVSDFLKIYFAQKGYKDGLHGLVLALFQAFYSFCIFAKAWEAQRFPQRDPEPSVIYEEYIAGGKEAKYWLLTMIIDETQNRLARLVKQIKRKLIRIHA